MSSVAQSMADSAVNNIAVQSQAIYLKPTEAKQQQQLQSHVIQQSSGQASSQIGASSGVAVASALKAANDSFARIVMTGLISNPSGSVSEVDLSSFSNDPDIDVDQETVEAQLANSVDRTKEYEKRTEFSDKEKSLYNEQSESKKFVERNENSKKLQSAAQETSEYKKNIFLRVSESDDVGKALFSQEARLFDDSISENSIRASALDQPSILLPSAPEASSSTTQFFASISERNGQERIGTTRVDTKLGTKGEIERTEKQRILVRIQSERSEHRAESDKTVSSLSKEKMHTESTNRIDVPAVFSVNFQKQKLGLEKSLRKAATLEKLSPIEKLRRRIDLRREIRSEFKVKR